MLFVYVFYRKELSEQGLFPLVLQDEELQWKIILNYDLPSNKFLLAINGAPFSLMPRQYQVNPKGPQNITMGAITLNDDVVHDGWAQFDADTVYEWCSELDKEPLTDIHIGID